MEIKKDQNYILIIVVLLLGIVFFNRGAIQTGKKDFQNNKNPSLTTAKTELMFPGFPVFPAGGGQVERLSEILKNAEDPKHGPTFNLFKRDAERTPILTELSNLENKIGEVTQAGQVTAEYFRNFSRCHQLTLEFYDMTIGVAREFAEITQHPEDRRILNDMIEERKKAALFFEKFFIIRNERYCLA